MSPHREIDLLERQNPVREDEVPAAQSPMARALRERIALEDPGPPPVRPRSRWSRPLVPRVAAIGLTAIAIALGGLALVPGVGLLPGGGSRGATTVERAIAALQPTGDKILHARALFTFAEATPGGKSFDVQSEVWQRGAPPYERRETTYLVGEGPIEVGSNDNGLLEHYNPRTNTIIVYRLGESPTSPGELGQPGSESSGPLDGFRIEESILELLRSGKMREDGRISVDGREAIRIVSPDSEETLIVDAQSYEPIESRAVDTAGPLKSIQTTRFKVFELLPATEANIDLVSVRAQHPDARVVQPGN